MADYSRPGGKGVDYEINKSLDELVSEDQSMRGKAGNRHHKEKGAAADDASGHHSAGGPPQRGGHHHSSRGSGRYRNADDREWKSRNEDRSRSGPRKMRDEREVGKVVDSYGKNVEGKRVFVSNLAFETQWKYLKDHMRQAGDVVRADIFEDKTGTSRGIGLVEFRSKRDAQNCVETLHQTTLDGRKLYLKIDTQGHIFPPLQKKEFGYGPGMGPSFESRRGGYDHGRGRGMHHRSHNRSRSRSRSSSPPQARGGQRGFRGGKHAAAENRRRSSDNPERSRSRSPEQRRLTIQRRGPKKGERESSSDQKKTYSIHVSNLPYSVDKDQLKGAFAEFGKLLHSSVSLDERGMSRGFGVLEFESKEAAESAARTMDKASFNGREVTCKVYD